MNIIRNLIALPKLHRALSILFVGCLLVSGMFAEVEVRAESQLMTFTPNCVLNAASDMTHVREALFWNGSGYEPVEELLPGYGYYLVADGDAREVTVSNCTSGVDETGYAVELHEGWNLVGVPRTGISSFPTLFEKITSTGELYIYSTAGVRISRTTDKSLMSGGVYWIYMDDPAGITISAVSSPTSSGSGDYVLTPAVMQDANDPSKFTILLSALVDPETGTAVKELDRSNFKVVEGDRELEILSVEPVSGNCSKTDIVFLMDVTGSMQMQIDGVRDSVEAFADFLADTGQEVRVGAVTFGDDVRDSFPLTSDISSFKTYVSTLKVINGADGCDWPENPLDAIAHALVNFSFRREAQKIFILVTNSAMHQKGDVDESEKEGTYKAYGEIFCDWYPEAHIDQGAIFNSTADMILYLTRHRNVIHAVTSGDIDDMLDYRDMGISPGVLPKGTGGVETYFDDYGNVDLSVLPLKDIISSGYLITYTTESTGAIAVDESVEPESRKLIATINGEVKGETSF